MGSAVITAAAAAAAASAGPRERLSASSIHDVVPTSYSIAAAAAAAAVAAAAATLLAARRQLIPAESPVVKRSVGRSVVADPSLTSCTSPRRSNSCPSTPDFGVRPSVCPDQTGFDETQTITGDRRYVLNKLSKQSPRISLFFPRFGTLAFAL